MDLKNIQEIIEARARKRLEDDIQKHIDTFRTLRFMAEYHNDVKLPKVTAKNSEGKDYETTVGRLLVYQPNAFWAQIKEGFLPVYIAEESKAFIETVDRLTQDVNDLMNNQQHDY